MVVTPTATPKIQRSAEAGKFVWLPRRFESEDLNDVFLCVVATSSKPTNRSIFEQAQQRGVLCNVVSEAPLEFLLSRGGEARSSFYNDPFSPRQRRTMLHKLASRKTQDEMFRRWDLPRKG